MNLYDKILTILLLFVVSISYGQIQTNTNFEVLSNQPDDTRDTLTVLSDTSSVLMTWKYGGLLTNARDQNGGLGEFWVYNGSYWETLSDYLNITTIGIDTIIIAGDSGTDMITKSDSLFTIKGLTGSGILTNTINDSLKVDFDFTQNTVLNDCNFESTA